MNILFYKFKAGALQYAIFISVLIALMVFALISLSYLQNRLRVKSMGFKKSIQHSQLAVAFNYTEELPYGVNVLFELDDELNDSTSLYKEHWGVFDIIKSTSQFKNEKFERLALMGGYKKKREALYLKDNNQPLVIVGNTSINGNAFLGEMGVKTGTIAGYSYYGIQLIGGEILKSSNQLPELANKEHLLKLNTSYLEPSEFTFSVFNAGIDITNSFKNTTQVLYGGEELIVTDEKLVGNLIMTADSLIVVQKNAQLEDVILVAPKIEIQSGFEGILQLFATKSITVQNDCLLNYPSALVINPDIKVSEAEKSEKKEQILIGAKSIIKGTICYFSEEEIISNEANILIEEGSRIIGEVYCEQNIELRGEIIGSVYTKGFVSNQFGGSYQNHIYNGRIDALILPLKYAGLSFKGEQNRVAKWLY